MVRKINVSEILKLLNESHSKYEYNTGERVITYYFENGDRTHIEIGDDGASVSVMGKIIGNLVDLENWLYKA